MSSENVIKKLVEVIGLVAVDSEWGIGVGNNLPKFPKDDMRWFSMFTKGGICVVGRKTAETLKESFTHSRTLFVVSGQKPNAPHGSDPDEVLDSAIEYAYEHGNGRVFVIGGASIYQALRERINTWYVSQMTECYGCDVTFPIKEQNLGEYLQTTYFDEFYVSKYHNHHCREIY